MRNLEDLEQCAAVFWEPIPQRNEFPRDLEQHLSLHYEASIESMSDLTVNRVQQWLLTKALASQVTLNDRRLDGCIIAQKGHAILFIDAALALDERRMIIAHETAHFWIDYELPRRRIKQRYGAAGMQILDKERPSHTVEVLMAAATGSPIQEFYHYHFKDRKRETEVEQQANTLACLLIAPPREVLARARRCRIARDDESKWMELLHQGYGMPGNWARGYLPLLLRNIRGRSFSAWFLPPTSKVKHDE